MSERKLTEDEKMQALVTAPELLRAVGLLIAAYKDLDCKSHLRFTYPHEGVSYELNFMPIRNRRVYLDADHDITNL